MAEATHKRAESGTSLASGPDRPLRVQAGPRPTPAQAELLFLQRAAGNSGVVKMLAVQRQPRPLQPESWQNRVEAARRLRRPQRGREMHRLVEEAIGGPIDYVPAPPYRPLPILSFNPTFDDSQAAEASTVLAATGLAPRLVPGASPPTVELAVVFGENSLRPCWNARSKWRLWVSSCVRTCLV